jgi:chitinase
MVAGGAMNVRRIRWWLVGSFLCVHTGSVIAQQELWATAYYAGWKQGWSNNGHLPAEDIDYSAVTHIVHFSLVPEADGTLDAASNSIREANSTELLRRAHEMEKRVLISVGGWASDEGFRGATSTANLPAFVTNLVAFMTLRGYDGIDIDWEPLRPSDAPQYIALITALRAALDNVQPRPLLTAAVGWEAEIIGEVHQHFDQINIMTYDMSGAWPGWVTWHNAPIHDGGFVFPSTGRAVPSADGDIERFLAAGIPARKLGIGIDFYGYVWRGGDGTPTGGATEPRQRWNVPPSVRSNVPYHTIMEDYHQPSRYRWDSSAHAAYLQIDNPGSADDMFVSYDDETTVRMKFAYARSRGIGGVFIWELGGGYRPDLPPGRRDDLLQEVKKALSSESPTERRDVPPAFILSQNFPNPFNPTTHFDYVIPMQSRVSLKVYNMLGERVTTIFDRGMSAGRYTETWTPARLASGMYLYRLFVHTETGQAISRTRKLIILK